MSAINFKNAKELQQILNDLEAQGSDLCKIKVNKQYTYYTEGECYDHEFEDVETADSVELTTDADGQITKITVS